jgi:hypothetical protein
VLNSYVYDDVDDMHETVCSAFFRGRLGQEFNWLGSSEVGLDNVTLGVRSFAVPSMDLSHLWLTQSRWNTMVRQYINPNALDATLGMVQDHLTRSKRKSGTATLRLTPTDEEIDEAGAEVIDLQTNLVEGRKSGRQVRRRWGSCMLALTYRNVPHPTVTLTSRTTYFGYLAIMDVMVANVFAQMCGGIVGTEIEDMRFVWHINLAQYHGFRSLAYPAGNPRMLKFLDQCVDDEARWKKLKEEGRFGVLRTLTGYRRILQSDREGRLYGDESFSSFCRVRRRFHTQVHGEDYAKQFNGGTRIGTTKAFKAVPSLPAESLTFSAIGR